MALDIEMYKNKRVLFVEPNLTITGTIKGIFQSLGLNISTTIAVDRIDARKKIKSSVYDIIISEYDLQEGNRTGQRLLEELRIERVISWTTGFVIATLENEKSKVLSTLEYWPDDYIIKPFTGSNISDRLKKTIEKKVFFKKVYDALFYEKYDEAIKELEKLSALNHFPLDIIRLKLVSYLKKGDYQSVINLYEQISANKKISSISQFPWFRYSYSKALYHIGRFQEAEVISAELKRRYPEYMENYRLLVDILHSQHKDEESLEVLKLAVSLSPLNMERQVLLGKKALQAGDMETAIHAHKTVIDKGSASCMYTIDTHANLAHLYGELGQFDEALSTLEQGVKTLKEDDPVGVEFSTEVMKSQIYSKKGDEAQAKSAFATALNIYDQQIAPTQGENISGISDDIKLFFSAECLENGHEDIAQTLISEVVEAGTHRQDILEKQLKKTLRTQDIAQKVGKIIEVAKQVPVEEEAIPEEIIQQAPLQGEDEVIEDDTAGIDGLDPDLFTTEDGFLKMTQELDQLSSKVSSIYDKIAGDNADELTQNFKNAMDKIEQGELHEAAQLLESIVDGPLDHNKTTYQNAIESVKSGDWKKAISILKLENIKNQDNPRTYFDLAQLSFFYLEKNLETVVDDDYAYEKMFFQAQDYFDKGMSILTSQNEGQYKSLVNIIKLVITKIEKKRSELKNK